MSLWLDKKYVAHLSPRLEQFKQKSEFLWNFRCPICGDSKKSQSKARGYIYRKLNDMFFMCHNCGASMKFENMIKSLDTNLYNQYKVELFKENTGNTSKPEVDYTKVITPPKFPKKKINLKTINDLPENHFAKTFLHGRKIPKKFFSQLYFAPDFKSFVDEILPKNDKKIPNNEARIVIPFYDKNKNLLCIQGRALDSSKIKYITIKLSENNMKIFGLDRINPDKTIYVVEGPFDSMFLENSIATGDASLTKVKVELGDHDFVFVFDNESRNTQLHKHMRKAIKGNFKICIWPNHIDEKDINDMVLAGYEPHSIIDKNTFKGVRAEMEFKRWTK